jgi:hypothetical protein
MKRWRPGFLSAPFLIVLCGCSDSVPAYAPPAQFVMPQGPDPRREVRLLAMNDLDAMFSVLEGVPGSGAGAEYKWTADRARFEFRVPSLDHNDLIMRYRLHSDTLKQTGPVRIAIEVDGQPFDSFVRGAAGAFEYLHAADNIPVRVGQPLIVTLTVQPPYIAKADKARLGILLNVIGFVPRQ